MITKYFFAAMISTLAIGAFSSESQVAGRYHADAPSNSGASVAQVGRYKSETVNTVSYSYQTQSSWTEAGQSKVAGRYQSNESQPEFATTRAYNNAPEFAQLRTQRANAQDVSNNPASPAYSTNRAAPCGCK